MKVIIYETQYNRLIDNFITFLFEPFEVIIKPNYPKSVFWVKDKKIIAEIGFLNFFLVYEKLWDQISDQFGLNYKETQNYMNIWLEKNYGLNGLSSESCHAPSRWSLAPSGWSL